MSEWALKRFWKSTDVAQGEAGFAIRLDGRPVRTPAKALLEVPTQPLAEAIAAEWDAQQDKVNPHLMPFTRSANAAIDKVRIQHAEVADLLAAYGDADLLCYRAATPTELVARQAQHWDPLLDWAHDTLGARLNTRIGVMHAAQDPQALAHLSTQVHALDPFQLAAFHDLVSLTSSLVIGFAAIHGARPADSLWDLSRLDETWQAEQWGADEEAEEVAALKRGEFLHAHRFFSLL